MQKTLKQSLIFHGVGLHSGKFANLKLVPAAPDTGIIFVRTDCHDFEIPAKFDQVSDATLNTRIGREIFVSTIEHLMSAFAGLGITNVRIELDQEEVPILDGSSKFFVEEILRTGIEIQGVPSMVAEVTRHVKVLGDDGAYAELHPHDGFQISFEIDFTEPAIGHQKSEFEIKNGVFVRELASCRTFCVLKDIELMQAHGMAKGGSLENALVFDGNKTLNPEGKRFTNEPIRHKILDALGDLYLAGAVLRGRYVGYKAGHRLTNQLLRSAFSQNAIQLRQVVPAEVPTLPGMASEDSRVSILG